MDDFVFSDYMCVIRELLEYCLYRVSLVSPAISPRARDVHIENVDSYHYPCGPLPSRGKEVLQ